MIHEWSLGLTKNLKCIVYAKVEGGYCHKNFENYLEGFKASKTFIRSSKK